MSAPPDRRAPEKADVLLVGGGLANSLIALALRASRPQLRILMLEQAQAAGADHTWSVFRSDLNAAGWRRLAPIFAAAWPDYDVAFPAHTRTLPSGYASLTSVTLRAQVEAELAGGLRPGCEVTALDGGAATCRDGRRFEAPLVIDGRGAAPSAHLELAFQKFVGLELRLRRPHGLVRPMVMDATVRQLDGFRFLYVLPLAADRLLVEDTRYSAGADLAHADLEAAVLRYARGRGWSVADIVRREAGVLPVVLGGDVDAYWRERTAGAPQVGMRGLFFHPTTGYSLPDAWQVAELVAGLTPDSATVAAALAARSRRLWRARSFYRALNRMLFRAARPEHRYRVLERFYRLPSGLIERFYAARCGMGDRLRILSGRPPVPVGRALAAIAGVGRHD